MNLGQINARLLAELKVKSKRYPEDVRTDHVNQAIRDLDDKFDSDQSEETTNWATVSGTGEYLISTYFASPAYEFAAPLDAYYVNSDGDEVTLEQLTYEELRSAYPAGSDGGPPLYFAIFEGKIYLRPTPDDAYTTYWSYTGRRRALANSTDSNDWTADESYAVIYGAARYGVVYILEEQRMPFFDDLFEKKIQNISIRQTGRMNARRPVSEEPG